jgi:hypothetical protein
MPGEEARLTLEYLDWFCADAECSPTLPLAAGYVERVDILDRLRGDSGAIALPVTLSSTAPEVVEVVSSDYLAPYVHEGGATYGGCLGGRIQALSTGRTTLEVRDAGGTLLDSFPFAAAVPTALRIAVYDADARLATGMLFRGDWLVVHLRLFAEDAEGRSLHVSGSQPITWTALRPDGTALAGDPGGYYGPDGFQSGTHYALIDQAPRAGSYLFEAESGGRLATTRFEVAFAE